MLASGKIGGSPFDSTQYFGSEIDNGNSGAADTIDWTAGNKQKSTLTGNCVFVFSPEPDGPCSLTLRLVQDATGARTVTWPADVKWESGTAPALKTTANAVDVINFYYDGTDFYGSQVHDPAGGAVGFDSRVGASLSANQVITTATWTVIDFDTVDYDGLSEFDTVNNKIVLDAAGYYKIGYYIPLENIGASKICEIQMNIDGADAEGGSNHLGDDVFSTWKATGSVEGYYAAGTEFLLKIYHNFAGNRSVKYSGAGGAKFWAHRFA